MNPCQFVLKMSIVLFALCCNKESFGMKCNYNESLLKIDNKKRLNMSGYDGNKVVYPQPETVIPMDIIESTAACAHDDTKKNFKMTCKHLNRVVSLDNINFVSHPLFTIGEKKLHKIAIIHSWKQNFPMVNALRRHLKNNIVIIPCYVESHIDDSIALKWNKTLRVETPSALYTKYINDRRRIDIPRLTKSEVDLAIYCAVLSNDVVAIKKLTPIIRRLNAEIYGYSLLRFQSSLLYLAIKKGNVEAFECIAKYDPFFVKNYWDTTFPWTYLETLNSSAWMGITEEERITYAALYKKHGGKTREELSYY